jgi:hypothetical protein
MGIELIAAIAAIPVFFVIGYLIGKRRGINSIQALGGHCDVCQKLASKVLVFRQQLICIDCYNAIMSNRDMKCRFCNKPAETCECI